MSSEGVDVSSEGVDVSSEGVDAFPEVGPGRRAESGGDCVCAEQYVLGPLASSPAGREEPVMQATHAWENTRSFSAHIVGVHATVSVS